MVELPLVEPQGSFRDAADAQPQDWEALAAYLSTFGHRLSVPPATRQFAGGLGNWNFLVHLDGRPHVLRRPPDGPLPAGANDMAREFRILGRLGAKFPLAPRAAHFCADSEVMGAPFLLIEYRPGLVIRDRLPEGVAQSPTSRASLTRQLVDVLVTLHELDPDAVGLKDLGRPEGMVARQAKNWTIRAVEAFEGNLPPALRTVASWLDRTPPPAQRVSLLHSDYKLDNLILEGATLAPVALIDWDMGTLGDPLLDVATLLSYWTEDGDHPGMVGLRQMPTHLPGFPKRSDVLEMYARRSGLSLDGFAFYRVLALFKLCVVFQQIHRRQLRGGGKHTPGAFVPLLVEQLSDFTGHVLAAEKF